MRLLTCSNRRALVNSEVPFRFLRINHAPPMMEKRIEQVTIMGSSCIMILPFMSPPLCPPTPQETRFNQHPAVSLGAGFELASLDPIRLSCDEVVYTIDIRLV